MKSKIPRFLLEPLPPANPQLTGRPLRLPFLEKGLNRLAHIIASAYTQWASASKRGFFQKIDARIKILFLLFFILIVSLKRNLLPEVGIGVFIFFLVVLSRLDIKEFYKKVFFLSFFFGFLVTLPSALNIITKGEIILPVMQLAEERTFWIYHFPQEIGFTKEGIINAILLTLRVANSLALSFLVLSTTSFSEIIKALKILHIPDSFLMIIALTYKYIFLFSQTVRTMHLAKKSRLISGVGNRQVRNWMVGRIALIFNKTRQQGEDMYKAMLSRGLSNKIELNNLRKLSLLDGISGIFFGLTGLFFLLI